MKFIIDRKVFISMLFIGMTLLGYVSYKQLNVEMLPNVELPLLYVQVSSSRDADPKYLESEVIIPLEGAVGSMEGVESIESSITSRGGTINVYFKKSVDFNLVYLQLEEKVNTLGRSMPDGISVSVARVDISRMVSSQFMQLQARGEGVVDRIRNVVDQEVVPQLENIDGIAGVSVYGGKEKSIEVIMDTKACEAYGITTSSIRSLLSQNAQSRVYAGNLREDDKTYFVHVTAEYSDVVDIENLVVAAGPILLKDVAEIRFGEKEVTSYSRVNGQEAVNIRLANDSQTNQIKLSHRVRDVVEKLNEKLEANEVQLIVQNDTAKVMEENMDQIINLAIVGGLLAIVVLWIFLKNLRIVAFVALSIPISVFTSFNLFYAFGITMNSLTMVGMALAVGLLLDNSVVVMENIYRLAGLGRSASDAVTRGTYEVWRSIVAATFTTVTVFLPFLFSSDYMIEVLGKNVGVSIVSTLIVSLIVAILLIPMAVHYLLTRKGNVKLSFEKISPNNRMMQIYIVLLKTCMRRPALTIISATLAFFITVILCMSLSVSSLTEAESDQMRLNITMPSGSSLERTNETVQKIEEILEEVNEKQDIITSVQEGSANITLTLKENFKKIDGRSFAEIKSAVTRSTRNVGPSSVSIQESASTSSSSSGAGNMAGNFQRFLGVGSSQERIVLRGQDFPTMQVVAQDIEYFISEMEFISSSRVNVSNNRPEVHMIFDHLLMAEYNINRAAVSSELNTFTGEVATGVMFKQDIDEYEIILKQDIAEQVEQQQQIRNMEKLRRLPVQNQSGGLHELQDFTRIIYARGLAGINRVNQEKQIEITYRMISEAQDSKELLESYRAEIDNLIDSYNFPTGIVPEVIHEENELEEFYFLILAAVILIYMILASVFESFSTPFVLLFSIPLAAIGSLLGLIFSGNSLFNANTMIGFLILIGIVVNNGIILIDYTNILRKEGFRMSRALMTAGLSRVRPILITAMTTIVAMFPLAMGDAEYVSVIGAPFAIVVIGGLSLSTLLTLVFIPTFYSGLENAISWIRSLNWKLKILQLILIVFFTVLIYFRVNSMLWQVLCLTITIVLVPGATWFVMNSLKKAGTNLIAPDEKAHIKIQSLVKIYDRPGQFQREWTSGIKLRQRLGLEKEYKTARDFDQLVWQLPVLAFLIYFTFIYLESSFWICLFMLFVYWSIRGMWSPMRRYIENKGFKKICSIIESFLYWWLPLIELVVFYMKINNIGAVIVLGILWYLGLLISVTSKRLYEQNINIDRITGRFGGMRRATYRMVKKIPIIGKRRVPFKALNGVSLEINTGMFGLLGPNGAGKSTMMRIICGIFEQSYGKIWINGIDTQEKREELQGLIGYLPQEFGTYENMSAWDYLNYQAMLKGLNDPAVRSERIEYVLKAVHMYERSGDKIGSYSGGMKQRIGIAQILLHLPRILVVDEPTAGLDPRERIRFRNLLVELSRERIVIFSTHIIEDIASSCNQTAVVIRGRLRYMGSPIDMVHLAEGLVWQFEVSTDEFDNIADKKMVLHHMKVGDNIRIRYLAKEKPAADAVLVTPMLEDAYLCLIKELKR